MNSDEMVEDNVKTATETKIGELTVDDEAMLKRVVGAINAKMNVPCTGCGYCMPCPKGVNISGTFSAYNKRYSKGRFAGLVDYLKNTSSEGFAPASACIGCGKCEKSCPHDAIHVVDNLAVIDYTKCTGCGTCAGVCPVKCIHEGNFICGAHF
jgi:predicted aldo/keto reductase-like oxidoreductase